MNTILKKRRVFKKVEKVVKESKLILNPKFSEYREIDRQMNYTPYFEEKYKTVYLDSKKEVRSSHIEYQILCGQCKSRCWVRRKDARYCSPTCRKVAYLERQVQETTPPSEDNKTD